MLRRHKISAVALATLIAACISCKPSYGEVIADSVSGWSSSGMQGENGWLFGWRNFTADGGGDYNFENDFILFVNDFSGGATPRNYLAERPNPVNNWEGTHWRLQDSPGDSGGPWTELFAENSHPNGTNSTGALEEHWTIRRWIATSISEPQTLELRSNLLATNVSCGNGTTVHVYQNGVLLDTLTTNSAAGVSNSVFPVINPNDVIDIALTPAGADGARGDSCDGSAYSLTITDEQPPPPPVVPIADSFDDWSTTGTQGERNWFNGYYNLTQDADGAYAAGDFMPFTNDGSGNPTTPGGNHWNGTQWDLTGEASGPWTELGQENTHPNGTNSLPNEEHWTIRRYVASNLTGTTPLALQWHTREVNDGGTGVSGKLFINGVEVDSAATDNTTGFTRTYYANVPAGATIDLALTPEGPTGDRGDGADGSANRLTIIDQLPEGPLFNITNDVYADSIAEFSGNQGENSFAYGLYDQRLDVEAGNGTYDVEDFQPFFNDGSDGATPVSPDGNHWTGTAWDLTPSGAPWTTINATGGHPTAMNTSENLHWALRRWTAEFGDSDATSEYVRIAGDCSNANVNGEGTTCRIFVNGSEVWSAKTNELVDEAGGAFAVDLQLNLSDVVDFAIDSDGINRAFDPMDPAGTIAAINDGSDGTNFSFTVTRIVPFDPIPEPSSALTLMIGIGMLGWMRRRGR